MLAKIADIMESVRAKTPLVHCITNYVTINDCANILLIKKGPLPNVKGQNIGVEEVGV
jgi:hydroxyethylthiazole kinase-like sugar kinase family protein